MKAIGIILAGGNNRMMRELSNKRAIAAMPIAGSYRAIDFALSNMTNSRIQKVAVITQYNARSLNEHLSSSKWWDFGRKQGGLFVFTPTITAESSNWYRGTADSLYQNMQFLKQSHEPYVVIASGDGVYKLDYNKVLQYHIEKKADITVVVKNLEDRSEIGRYGVVAMTEEGRITDIDEKPLETNLSTVSTGIYVIRRRLLIELLEKAAEEDRHEFVRDILVRYKNIKKIYERKLDFNGMKHRKFGFELEFTGISRDQAARTVAKVLRTEKLYAGGVYHTHVIRDSAHRIWRIVRDASIYPTVTARHSDPNYDHYKCELVSPILQYKELYLVSKIVCALKAKGASVNDSCGMHVHVDVGDYNAIQLRNLVNIVFGKEELLFKAFNVYGRRREWCTRLDREFLHMINEECGSKLTIKKIEDIWYRDMAERTSHYNLTRYYILNLHSYFQKKGVEFRLYNSTLETDEVKANIIFSIAMCSYAASHKKTASHIKEKPFWMIRARHLGNRDEMSSWLYQIGLRGDEFKFVRAYVKRYLTNEERSAA